MEMNQMFCNLWGEEVEKLENKKGIHLGRQKRAPALIIHNTQPSLFTKTRNNYCKTNFTT